MVFVFKARREQVFGRINGGNGVNDIGDDGSTALCVSDSRGRKKQES